MYKIPLPHKKLDLNFVNKFKVNELEVKKTTLVEATKEWCHDTSPLKPIVTRIPANKLKRPHGLAPPCSVDYMEKVLPKI